MMAAVHEGRVGDQAIGHQARQRQLRSFGQKRAKVSETGRGDCLPTNVIEQVLVRVNDQVLCARIILGD